MNILVTGGCGFIGSNYILRQMRKKSNKILNIDKLTYAGNLDNLVKINKDENYKFLKGDICNLEFLSNAIDTFQPNVIVHFAAESHVDRSIDYPLEFIDTNVVGTGNLLHASLKYWGNTKNEFCLIHVSTDEVFGSLNEEGLFDETTPYNPSSPYSASKASSDHFVKSWHRTYGLPAIITNCSNNYGPYQFPEKLIPLMIANCIDEKTLPIYGNGANIRDWLYVEDHCAAIDAIINNGTFGETYNIGGNNEIKNIDIVTTICNILDELKPRKNSKSYTELISYVEDRPGHDFRYAINASKIRNDINWTPHETFQSGILKTINWYINNKNWWRNIQTMNYSQERLGLKNA
jgi:dTDP-glucose 4,6-dehydratase